jgi:hypothetical protein
MKHSHTLTPSLLFVQDELKVSRTHPTSGECISFVFSDSCLSNFIGEYFSAVLFMCLEKKCSRWKLKLCFCVYAMRKMHLCIHSFT